MGPRSIPEINWHNIRPPYDWWAFFKDADRHPFRYQATAFDMLNAWWLIEASTLTYSNPEFAQRTFAGAGFSVVRFFSGQSTQAFVASNDTFVVVAFRGTETSVRREKPDYLDVLYDLLTVKRILLVPYDGGLVHRGFKLALDEIWWDRKHGGRNVMGLKSYLDDLLAQKERPMWFTGHSLGGALATLAAKRYNRVRGLYTFGSPRVGDLEFRNHYSATHFRFVNDDDIVPRVPPQALLYHHVGEMIFIDGEGHIQINPADLDIDKDAIQDSVGEVVKSIERIRRGASDMVPSGLMHHVPILYRTHIWNSYLQNE